MIDYYKIVGPILKFFPAETAQRIAINSIRLGLLLPETKIRNPALETVVEGLKFPNPLGLAAGFDKDAETGSRLFKLGFGSVEYGTVTPEHQLANPGSKLFRLEEDEAAINRFGFPSEGLSKFACRLEHAFLTRRRPGVVGVNIGPNRHSADPVRDYELCFARLYDVADYLVANISSPNTPALRELQYGSRFAMLVERLANLRERQTIKRKPLFFKIAPELTSTEVRHMVVTALSAGADGFVVGNTTTERPKSLRSPSRTYEGGLSGKPLFSSSTALLRQIFQESGGRLTLVGVGGIFNAENLYEKIRAGASFCQIYTCLYYKGPHVVPTLLQGLCKLLARDGFNNVSEAVGAEHFSQTRHPTQRIPNGRPVPIGGLQPKSAVA